MVLRGKRQSNLEIFNRHGRQIGAAKRSRGRYSRDGYRYRYELLGLRPRFILTDVSKGRFVSVPEHLTLTGVDTSRVSAYRGTAVADSAIRQTPRLPSDSFVFERNGEVIATLLKMPRKELRQVRPRARASNPIALLQQLDDRFFSGQLFYVMDPSNRQVARITYLPVGQGYVLEQQPGTQDLLRTIAVAACIIVNNAFASARNGGAG